MNNFDKEEFFEKLNELWEAFLFSPQADDMNHRIEMYEFLKILRKFIYDL